jgi:methionyl aminopeptidase
MILLKSSEQVELIKKAANICSDTLSLLSSLTKEGTTGLQLDKIAYDYILSREATPSCLGYKDYPNSLCVSINSGAVHNIPTNKPFVSGSIVKLDLVVNYKGWNADSAISVLIPPVRPEVRKLAEATYTAMLGGISAAIEGNRVSDISKAIYEARIESGVIYGVIKEFTGHAIGKDIHEAPQIPNYVVKERDALLVTGMVLCIEPIFCIGDPSIFHNSKQWDTWLLSGNPVAHFEHTISINSFPNPPSVLTKRNNENI